METITFYESKIQKLEAAYYNGARSHDLGGFFKLLEEIITQRKSGKINSKAYLGILDRLQSSVLCMLSNSRLKQTLN